MKKALSKKNLWEGTPLPLKAALGCVLGASTPALWLGRRFRASCRFLREAEWWSAEAVREFQLEKLRKICRLAYSETPYYRRTFDAVGFHPNDLKTLEDFALLPTIDKRTVQNHRDEMCVQGMSPYGVDLCTTGGTGGAPLAFYLDHKRSAVGYAYLVTSWERAGYSVGRRMGVFRGRVVKPDRKGLHHEYDPALRRHYYSSYQMTDSDMRRYMEHVAALGPCFLYVYPSTAASLSRFLRRHNMEPPKNILGIIAESENVYPDQRADIEATFKTRMFSCYGHSERLVFAAECEHSTDYHVWPTYGYFELLDRDSEPMRLPGGRGEIVGTGFISTVMPFIRYRTGDYATYVGNRCEACGREHTLVREIRGHRTQESLIAADGTILPWTGLSVDGSHSAFIHVRQIQFYQDTPGHALLRIVPAEGFNQESRRGVCEFFEWKFAGAVDFTVECVDAIVLSPRGKAIYVDQQIEGC